MRIQSRIRIQLQLKILMRIRIQIRGGGGGRSAKNVHPPLANPRYAPAGWRVHNFNRGTGLVVKFNSATWKIYSIPLK